MLWPKNCGGCISVKETFDATEIFCPAEVDAIFMSYVRSDEAVLQVRKLVRDFAKPGQNVSIVSKIEDELGCEHAAEIIQASDGIVVARGDMGIEIPAEKVILI